MKKYLSILTDVEIFKNIKEDDIVAMLSCLNAKINNYTKGEFIFIAGEKVTNLGIILKGNVHIIKEDFEGERTIIATLSKGEYFAEALCCANIQESPVTVVANNDCEILFLEFSRILHSCTNSCIFHTQLIENMLYVIANKNIILQNRLEIMSQKTLRKKILSYLNSLAIKQGSNITIPFNREEFADFLCVDRTSLSHELSRMKSDGLIDYQKNHFNLL